MKSFIYHFFRWYMTGLISCTNQIVRNQLSSEESVQKNIEKPHHGFLLFLEKMISHNLSLIVSDVASTLLCPSDDLRFSFRCSHLT